MTNRSRSFSDSPDARCTLHSHHATGAETNGLLVMDKPAGLTSFGVVAQVRKLLGAKKVGHCGTLDPFATGVLIVCLNQATRIVEHLSEQDKVYRFTIRFGIETDTLDMTGQVVRTSENTQCSEIELQNVLNEFRGPYLQEVPRYSAVKIQGRRLHKLSRSGIEVDLPKRQVHIHALELMEYRWPQAQLEACCSKGTYIRQLASDLGTRLGCGGHVSELRRLASGPFRIDQANPLDTLREEVAAGTWERLVLPVSDALAHLPSFVIRDEIVLKRLMAGHLDTAWQRRYQDNVVPHPDPVRLVSEDHRLIALWWPYPEPDQRHRLRVFGHGI